MVVIVLVLLGWITFNQFKLAEAKSRDVGRKNDLHEISKVIRLYYNDNQSYPSGSGCTTCLNSVLSSYTSGVAGVGYTYTAVDSNNGFLLTVGLESGAGNDDINSQSKCGVATPIDKVYAVCAY